MIAPRSLLQFITVAAAALAALAPICGLAAAYPTVLQRVSGAVFFVRSVDGADDRLPVLSTMEVPENATAETAPGARAIVSFADSSEVRMEQATRLRIGRFSAGTPVHATLRLLRGAIRLDVRRGPSDAAFAIATENLEVRATDSVIVRTDATSTRVTCVRGTAAITSRDGQIYELVEHQSMTQTWDAQGTMEMHLDPMQ